MWLLVSALFFCFVVLVYRERDPPPIFGVYRQRGSFYHLKYALFYLLFRTRRWYNKNFKQNGNTTEKQVGYGSTVHSSIADMDKPQPLSNDPKAFDAVFFMATNKKGYYFVVGAERRPLGVINGLCYLVVPELGLLCSKKIPDTILFGAKENEYCAEGISIKPVYAMNRWKVCYEGKMWLQKDPTQEFEVKVDGDWTSELPYFNFDTDLHPSAIARAIATEVWTRKYFQSLKEAHQTHYEQMGYMEAVININGEAKTEYMQAFRDHSYGNKRDWNLMHRYAFHMMFMDNGMMAAVGVICQPCTGSMLQTGYVYTPEGELHALEWCDLLLYQHGENGTPPTDHAFRFKAGPTVYTVKVAVQYQSIHNVGWNWEARMVERFVQYTVNDIPGRGVSEFHYFNNKGRPEEYSKNDPMWFKVLKYKQ